MAAGIGPLDPGGRGPFSVRKAGWDGRVAEKLECAAEARFPVVAESEGNLMSQERLPPPQPDLCLIQSRKAKYRGGTLIAEQVWSVEEHERRLRDAEGYRPERCQHCGCRRLHVHDYPLRRPQGEPLLTLLRVVRFICSNEECGATWRVLPAFLARHLWWVWRRVSGATREEASPVSSGVEGADGTTVLSEGAAREGRVVPERTRRRWQERLSTWSRQLVVLMASRGAEQVQRVAKEVGLGASRRELVSAYERALATGAGVTLGAVAALMDRLERGVRLM